MRARNLWLLLAVAAALALGCGGGGGDDDDDDDEDFAHAVGQVAATVSAGRASGETAYLVALRVIDPAL